MKKLMGIIGLILGLAIMFGLSCSDGNSGDCERVTQGESDVVIRNMLSTGVEAFFQDIALGALIQPGKCEKFGMPAGSREVELTQCNFVADDNCVHFGPSVEINLPLDPGEEVEIDVTSSLF